MWHALGSPGQHRGAREGRALGPKSLRVTNGKGKGKTKSGEEECKKRLPAVNAAPAVKFAARMQVVLLSVHLMGMGVRRTYARKLPRILFAAPQRSKAFWAGTELATQLECGGMSFGPRCAHNWQTDDDYLPSADYYAHQLRNPFNRALKRRFLRCLCSQQRWVREPFGDPSDVEIGRPGAKDPLGTVSSYAAKYQLLKLRDGRMAAGVSPWLWSNTTSCRAKRRLGFDCYFDDACSGVIRDRTCRADEFAAS